MASVTFEKTSPAVLAISTYRVLLDGTEVTTVSKYRDSYDADRYNPKTRYARMVTSTYWHADEPRHGGSWSGRIRHSTRNEAVVSFLAGFHNMTRSEAREALDA